MKIFLKHPLSSKRNPKMLKINLNLNPRRNSPLRSRGWKCQSRKKGNVVKKEKSRLAKTCPSSLRTEHAKHKRKMQLLSPANRLVKATKRRFLISVMQN
jgi:hypothetical protein